MNHTIQPFWLVIPAAGSGQRMQSAVPKQFLTVAGRSVLQHTLDRVGQIPGISGLVLATADHASAANWTFPAHFPCHRVAGGSDRAESVLAGVEKVIALAGEEVWVLVHDAARPGVRVPDVEELMARCVQSDQGGILAQPVRDTIKQAHPDLTIKSTLARDEIWLAQTPQCFRAGPLRDALRAAIATQAAITDEASAMALAGHPCQLVPGHWRNMKLTEPEDMPLLAWILSNEG